MIAASTKKKSQQKQTSLMNVKVAKRNGFWRGVSEGFGGPILMGCTLPHVSNYVTVVVSRDHEKNVYEARYNISRALAQATKQVMEKHGLTTIATRQKQLDDSGKMQDVVVKVVGSRSSHHGESQK